MITPVLQFGTTYLGSVTWESQTTSQTITQEFSFTTVAAPPVVPVSPNLLGNFSQQGLSYISSSPSPVTVTITRLPSNTLVSQATLTTGQTWEPTLPGANYQACFSQAATVNYLAATDCEGTSWESLVQLHITKTKRRNKKLYVQFTSNTP